MNKSWIHTDLGKMNFMEFLLHQTHIVEKRKENFIPDTIITCRIKRCYSTGGLVKNANEDFKNKEEVRKENERWHYRGIPIFPASRGGRTTYHDEGQFNIMPILNVSGKNPEWLRNIIADVIINTLLRLKIPAEKKLYENKTTGIASSGLYVGYIGAFIKASGVSCFGASLNINADMKNFNAIYPCGIKDKKAVVGNITELRTIGTENIINALKHEYAALIKKEESV